MTQESGRSIGVGKLALGGAAALLAGVLGYKAWQSQVPPADPAQVAPVSTAAQADGVTALERRVADSPKDAVAWRALGSAYFDLGRFDDAVRAYEGATAADPASAEGWSALGEARVMASRSDPMPRAALEAFQRAALLDASDPRARYFLAVKKDLGGDHSGAIADWLALLADTPRGAPWEADLRRTIEQVGRINGIDVSARLAAADKTPQRLSVAAQGIPGPSQQDLAAARSIPPGAQREMAEGMVARLEARLKSQPANVDGWVMLVRSRMTLGQPDKAAAALKAAIAANPRAEARLRQEAEVLGVR